MSGRIAGAQAHIIPIETSNTVQISKSAVTQVKSVLVSSFRRDDILAAEAIITRTPRLRTPMCYYHWNYHDDQPTIENCVNDSRGYKNRCRL